VTADQNTRRYVLGHSDGELARLEKQATLYSAFTQEILTAAGLKRGMRVLDVGCGVGDVSLAAAGIVGPEGSVLGVDRAAEALHMARHRVEAAGLEMVGFETTDFTTAAFDQPFDAVIGRFILLYMADAPAILKKLAGHLKPGGILAFMELDVGSSTTVPHMTLFDRAIGWIVETYTRVGIEPNMGSRLFGVFGKAGLEPTLIGRFRVEGGPDSRAYEFLAETVRSLAPRMEELGVATAEEIGVDTLAERVRAEALANDTCFFFPRLVGAYARLPG
jgi:ubiquinone/menaquinone biosynthesis C-methylase UbiE